MSVPKVEIARENKCVGMFLALFGALPLSTMLYANLIVQKERCARGDFVRSFRQKAVTGVIGESTAMGTSVSESLVAIHPVKKEKCVRITDVSLFPANRLVRLDFVVIKAGVWSDRDPLHVLHVVRMVHVLWVESAHPRGPREIVILLVGQEKPVVQAIVYEKPSTVIRLVVKAVFVERASV